MRLQRPGPDGAERPVVLAGGVFPLTAGIVETGATEPAEPVVFEAEALRHPAVSAVVLGARTPEEVTANAEYPAPEIPAPLWTESDRAASC
ncbi:hypothetical protein [Amycolatopsis thermophila]|uniref:Uncharacterized protein n=1 Tax=Amycolatopsis thermophila TaxID=206084 RepID=A0ABU0F667_9PSEU|nr:hypothetical protein [Amycolatopsis thermophila]MDQ0383087.1 hypothetical protein [Amycolatopsis thermophila]